MTVFTYFKSHRGKDKRRIDAINTLPDAFSLFTGSTGVAKVKRVSASIGSFELHFNHKGSQRIAQMLACHTGEALVFSIGNCSVVISGPFTAKALQPVIEMALVSSIESN